MGVTCVVVHDTVSVDGGLIEDTYDWCAQHKDGSVWYFGEDTKEIENGLVKSRNCTSGLRCCPDRQRGRGGDHGSNLLVQLRGLDRLNEAKKTSLVNCEVRKPFRKGCEKQNRRWKERNGASG
jgi:hypothetical protein